MTKRTRQPSGLSRRQILKADRPTAALLAAAKLNFPAGAFAQGAGPEVKGAKLGFIALTDATPLFVAKEKGIFAKYGMPDVEVQKQASWGTTRDNLVLGSEGNGIDGAHILTPMPYLISAGKVTQNNEPTPMYILARLNLNGQCISVSKEYADLKVGIDTAPFKAALEKKKAAGKAVKAAMTFPGGTHDLWIRYWLAAGGIDPDKDIETIVVPPPQMVANMKVGTMDCFCVCEPWNLQLIHQEIGYTAITTGELWDKHPEKSFGMRAAWVDKISEGRQGAADGGDGSPAVVREDGEPRGGRGDLRQAPVDQLPGRGHHRPHEGQVRLRHRPRRRELAAADALLEGPRLLSVPEPRPLVPHRGHPLGQVRAGFDTKALIAKVNREDLWKEAAKDARRCERRHPDLDLARQGDLLRRQGVRSRKSGRLSEVARDQARRSLMRACGRPRAAASFEAGEGFR